MASVVADTHSVVWFLHGDTRLSPAAQRALRASVQAGDPIFIASISLVELTYLVEKGRLPGSAMQILRVALTDFTFDFRLAPLDLRVADAISRVPRNDVPDMPDRVIAAMALALKVPLVTCDGRIRSSEIHTIW